MSTDTDGAPSSVQSGPDDVPGPREQPRPDSGSTWLQDEIRRRMAERSSGGGGRHARRDGSAVPPGGAGHVPRHSVAPAPAPAPRAVRPPSVDAPLPVRRPAPPPGPVGGPSLPDAGAPPARRPVPAGGGWSGPEPAAPPAPADDTGPALPPRPLPRAYTPGSRGVPEAARATFGGPGFDAPAARPDAQAARQSAAPEAHPTFGGPGFGAPATRDVPATGAPPAPGRVSDDAATSERSVAAPTRPRPAGGSDVRPPRAPARLLAAPGPAVPGPGPVVEALGRRPDPSPVDPLDLTGPVLPADAPTALPDDDDEVGDDGYGGDGDTVLWSASMPPLAPGEVTTAVPAVPVDEAGARRVKVVLSERRNGAHPVRTVVDIQEGGVVGELLRSNLIGSQLTVALRFALLAGLTLGLLPLAFALFPAIGRVEVFGMRLPWLLLGVLVYPLLWGLGWWHARTAERVEQNFADHVQE